MANNRRHRLSPTPSQTVRVLVTALCGVLVLSAYVAEDVAGNKTNTRGANAAAAARTMLATPGPPDGEAITTKPEHVYSPCPASTRIMRAKKWLTRRSGRTSFAVINSKGKLRGWHYNQRFHSASLVKAMLLVGYLRQLPRGHHLSTYDRSLLYPMIHRSDNGAATAVRNIIGDAGLRRVARATHMKNFVPGGAFWGQSQITAADQARFFYYQDSHIPKRFDGYARHLLSHIEADQRWGIPAGARGTPFRVFFKGGWLPTTEGAVNQAARLERRHCTFAVAVLTTHDPSMGYGEETLRGVTARLVGHAGR